MCVYTRARESLPAIYPVFCKYMTLPCNTYCGYLKSGRCTFGEYEKPFDICDAKVIDERMWYLQQLANLKSKE